MLYWIYWNTPYYYGVHPCLHLHSNPQLSWSHPVNRNPVVIHAKVSSEPPGLALKLIILRWTTSWIECPHLISHFTFLDIHLNIIPIPPRGNPLSQFPYSFMKEVHRSLAGFPILTTVAGDFTDLTEAPENDKLTSCYASWLTLTLAHVLKLDYSRSPLCFSRI